MDTNYPSIYLGQNVDFFFPPAIPLEEMNAEQQASFTYWKQYAQKHHISYDYDEEKQILSNFRAIDRQYQPTDKDMEDLINHVTDKRKGTKMRFFYFIVVAVAYIFLAIKEQLFNGQTHAVIGFVAFAFLITLWIRFKHYWMHPEVFVVAQVLKLNEEKQKVWNLKHFGDRHWEKLKKNG